MVSHAIPNHFAGVSRVLQMHQAMGRPKPKIYKHLDGNNYEIEVFTKMPHLVPQVHLIIEGTKIRIQE